MTRRRVAVGCSLAALAVTLILYVVLHEPSQSIELPDGSTLRLIKTSYGCSIHFHFHGNLFDKLLYGWVPASWMTSGGSRMGSLRTRLGTAALARSAPIYTATNELAFWMQHTGVSAANSNSVFLIEAIDDNDAAWGQVTFAVRSFWTRSQSAPLLTGTVGVFDRRGERIHLRVLCMSNKVWRAAGEFSIRNPDPQRTPSWSASELPTTVQVGDNSIALRNVWVNPRSDSRPDVESGMEFGTDPNARSSFNWSVENVVLSDATGNRWHGGIKRNWADFDSESIKVPGSVPTNETLRIEATLVRKRDFRRDQIWEVRDVPLPLPGQFAEVTNATLIRDGVTISLVGVAAANANAPNGARVGMSPILYFRSTDTNSGADSWRLSLVGILGKDGRTIGHGYSASRLAHSMQLGVNYPADMPRATFVLALHQPTNVVFHARARWMP